MEPEPANQPKSPSEGTSRLYLNISSVITFISQSNTDGKLKCYSVAAAATLASREEGNYTQNCKFADDDDIK